MPDLGAALGTAPAKPAIAGAGAPAGADIVVDDSDSKAVTFEPDAAWMASKNPSESNQGGSRVTPVDGKTKKAIFTVNVPAEGDYEVLAWWVASNADFRSTAVPVTIEAKDGPQKTTVDQTKGGNQWNSIGKYKFAAGPAKITISTEGLTAGATLNVSADAVKLVRK